MVKNNMKLYVDQDNYKNSYLIPENRKDYCNFECNGITLLTGLNGSGKTSFINAIRELLWTNVHIFDKPENELHQKAQVELMDQYIANANDVFNIIIETHSESMFTRLRLRVKQGVIDKNRVHIYWFEKDMNFQEIKIDKNGELDYWPKNFFDQQYNDLMELIQ